jgi:hypothetical protein
MKLISPTNREVDIGQTLLPNEYIGMTRREVLDTYLRDRAISMGTLRVCLSFTLLRHFSWGLKAWRLFCVCVCVVQVPSR